MNLEQTDPEFMTRFEHFAMVEVVEEKDCEMEKRLRYMAILAALLGCQGVDEFQAIMPQALEAGVSPVAVKEIIYQAAAYLGMGRIRPFLTAANTVFSQSGIELPLAGQATTTQDDRLEKGVQAQVDIFGPGMKNAWQKGHINRWLAANCFGDYYTRTGLTFRERELLTFCFLAAQGGCEAQLLSHVQGNLHVGNHQALLVSVISQVLPYIGYPRSLNAIACVEQAAAQQSEKQSIFPIGGPNDAFAQYFIGQSYLNMLTTEGVSIGNVTFEPGCRNNWHIHQADEGGGQILLCLTGRGWYQEWGHAARELQPGDVVVIKAGIKHWHGAAKDSWFTHLAVEVPGENASTEWLEAVDEESYQLLK